MFSNRLTSNTSPPLGAQQRSFSLGKEEIDEIVKTNSNQCKQLSSVGEKKLKSLTRLRSLQENLSRVNNAKNCEEYYEIRAQIEQFKRTEKEDPRVYNLESTIILVMERGPDFCQYISFVNGDVYFLLFSSVLFLRPPFTIQPLVKHGLVLQYNGEIYGETVGNDTEYFLHRIVVAISAAESDSSREETILNAVPILEGEFAFVLTDTITNKIYFGKDSVGKRSLLYVIGEESILLSSVLPNKEGDIVECKGGLLYLADLSNFTVKSFERQNGFYDLRRADLALSESTVSARTSTLRLMLSRSCFLRQNNIQAVSETDDTIHIGVLFSGGLDCTVVAALLAQNYISDGKTAEIELLNVGFENPRTGLSAAELPDRALGERSFSELRRLFRGTCVLFRLVIIDVSYEEWLHYKPAVRDLIHPTNTEMDLSIAIAFYFACRAQNCRFLEQLPSSGANNSAYDYTSRAKVLFSGLGADELFGGYSRHEAVFNCLCEESDNVAGFYDDLNAELAKDLDIIYLRNLGRDDRAMCCWGKEIRYPFLDSLFVEFSFQEIEPNLKVKFAWADQKTKKGTKRVKLFERKYILRQLARELGLLVASEEPKRAIQFGAKTAKMEVGLSKIKGTDLL